MNNELMYEVFDDLVEDAERTWLFDDAARQLDGIVDRLADERSERGFRISSLPSRIGMIARPRVVRPDKQFQSGARFTNAPTPGAFYKIQFGKGGLIRTAARAYGVPLRPNPIRLAKLINDHPYNRRFWRSPKNAFERRFYPSGLINFNPRFVGAFADQMAVGFDERAPRGRRFAIIWIPNRFQLSHPTLVPAITFPKDLLVDALASNAFCAPVLSRAHCPTAPIPNTAINNKAKPFQWICHIIAVFLDPAGDVTNVLSGSGFLIRNNVVASCAHLLYNNFEIVDLVTKKCVDIFRGSPSHLIISPGRRDAKSPFGTFVVDVKRTGAKPNLVVHPRWIKATDKREKKQRSLCNKDLKRATGPERKFDIALLSLKGATTFGSATFRRGHFGTSFTDSAGNSVTSSISEPAKGLRPKTTVSIGGYPSDLRCLQSISPGHIRLLDPQLIATEASISKGNSGAPVLMKEDVIVGTTVKKHLRVVGIATEADHPFCTLSVRLSGHTKFMKKALGLLGC